MVNHIAYLSRSVNQRVRKDGAHYRQEPHLSLYSCCERTGSIGCNRQNPAEGLAEELRRPGFIPTLTLLRREGEGILEFSAA